jgi:transposase
MDRFPTAGHLASWAGLCPGKDASAGKRRSGKTTKGSPSLRAALVPAAWAASQSRGTSLAGQDHRLVKRMGKQQALVAVAHSMLVMVSHLLSRRTRYADLGESVFKPRSVQGHSQRLIRQLEALGLYPFRL